MRKGLLIFVIGITVLACVRDPATAGTLVHAVTTGLTTAADRIGIFGTAVLNG